MPPKRKIGVPAGAISYSGGESNGSLNTTPMKFDGVNQVKPSQQEEDPLNAAYEESPADKAPQTSQSDQLNISPEVSKMKAVGEGARRIIGAADDRGLGLKDLSLARKGEGVSKESDKVIQSMAGEVTYKVAPAQNIHRIPKAQWDEMTAKLKDLEAKSSALEQYVTEKKERAKIKEMLRKEVFRMGITGLPDKQFIGKKETQIDEQAVDELKTKTQKGTIEPGATKAEVEKAVAPTVYKRRVWL